MIRVEYFCTRCNASAQRRDPGDEISTGYQALQVSTITEAKRTVLVVPAKWAADEQGHLICPACVAQVHPVSAPEPPVARHDGWPSRSSPFENV